MSFAKHPGRYPSGKGHPQLGGHLMIIDEKPIKGNERSNRHRYPLSGGAGVSAISLGPFYFNTVKFTTKESYSKGLDALFYGIKFLEIQGGET